MVARRELAHSRCSDGAASVTRARCRMALALMSAIFMAALSGGCGGPRAEHRPEWVLHSRVVFYSRDLSIERASLPATEFRVFFPYIIGDLYGSPDTGDFIQVQFGEQHHFAIDLNA